MQPSHAILIGVVAITLVCSFAPPIQATPVNFTGPVILSVSSATEGGPLSLSLIATGSIFLDLTSFLNAGEFMIPVGHLEAENLRISGPGFPIPPWPHGFVDFFSLTDSSPIDVQGDVLLFLPGRNGAHPQIATLDLFAHQDINIGVYSSPVPEPATWIMFALGLVLLVPILRFRQRRNACRTEWPRTTAVLLH
jgi:PEP-CTERM motif-containing protein